MPWPTSPDRGAVPTYPLAKCLPALKRCRHVPAPRAAPQGRQAAPLLVHCREPPGLWRAHGAAPRAYLGEINDAQQAAWCRTIEAFEERGHRGRQIALFPEDRTPPALECDVVQVRLSFLRQRWQDLFAASFEVLLYDLTSTYFECDPPEAGKRRFGHWRDKRSDTVGEVGSQVAIAAKREVRVGASGRWANHAPSRSRLIAAAVATLCRPILASPQ